VADLQMARTRAQERTSTSCWEDFVTQASALHPAAPTEASWVRIEDATTQQSRQLHFDPDMSLIQFLGIYRLDKPAEWHP
jgi:hypothetical protein